MRLTKNNHMLRSLGWPTGTHTYTHGSNIYTVANIHTHYTVSVVISTNKTCVLIVSWMNSRNNGSRVDMHIYRASIYTYVHRLQFTEKSNYNTLYRQTTAVGGQWCLWSRWLHFVVHAIKISAPVMFNLFCKSYLITVGRWITKSIKLFKWKVKMFWLGMKRIYIWYGGMFEGFVEWQIDLNFQNPWNRMVTADTLSYSRTHKSKRLSTVK